LYMAGARLATYYPVSIPAHGVALNITVQSYNGSLDYGFTACRRAVPDVDDLIEYLVEAHRELRHLVLGPQAAAAKPLEKAEQTATRVAAEKMPAQVAAEPAKRSHAAKGKAARPVNGKAAAASDTAAAPAKARRSPKKTAPKAPSPAKRKAKTKAAEPVAAAPPDKALN
jgi:diacylglycerol O-acyltransferase